jgi:hypothetical protein
MAFDREVMRGVVRHYAAQRLQDVSCPDCQFQPYEDPDETIPDGWEPVRGHDLLTKQCPAHDRPEYPWLAETPVEKAANWLVLQSCNGPFRVNFDEWKRACEAS